MFGHRTKFHMALAQHLRNQKYFDFFAQKLENGETVIMDNGAYENMKIKDVELATWATRLKPSVVVLPDCPHDARTTLMWSQRYLATYGVPNEAMMVLHAPPGNTAQFEAVYALCDVKWIGFSKLTADYGVGGSRAEFVQHLKNSGRYRPELIHHALGLRDNEIRELWRMKDVFFSCDSARPIWRGLHGYPINGEWKEYMFEPDCAPEVHNLIQAGINLDYILEECGEDRSGDDIEMARP